GEPHPAAQLGRQMKALHRYISSQVMGAMQEQLQGDDLSFSQMTAMHQLRSHAPLSVGGLAELTGLSLPAASHLTDRLVQRGYAERLENPDDRRAKLLSLTPAGLEILESMDRRFTDTYRRAFERVSPGVLLTAAGALQAVLAEIRGQPAPQTPTAQAPASQPSTAQAPDLPQSPHSPQEQA
ncbi:MAG: MarR family winged helix-turn-helix transcriptional regulator, partial [Deinococcus sp.]